MKKQFVIFSLLIIFSITLISFIAPVADNVKLCFALENEMYTNYVEITFLENNKVEGILDVYIHDEEMGYETSSYSEFKGKIIGEKVNVNLTIEIEGNTEFQSETWLYKENTLLIDGDTYIKTDCRKD